MTQTHTNVNKEELQKKIDELYSLIKDYNVSGLSITMEEGKKLTRVEEVDALIDLIHRSVELMKQFPKKPEDQKKEVVKLSFFEKVKEWFKLKHVRYECYIHWIGCGDVHAALTDDEGNKILRNFSFDFFIKRSRLPAEVGYKFVVHKFNKCLTEEYILIPGDDSDGLSEEEAEELIKELQK
jgi:hypothetical protein